MMKSIHYLSQVSLKVVLHALLIGWLTMQPSFTWRRQLGDRIIEGNQRPKKLLACTCQKIGVETFSKESRKENNPGK